MVRYIARRVAMQFAVLIASTIIIFILLHLAPGNPATLLNGGHPPSPATVKYFNRLYGFNRPLPIQYLIWLRHLVEGNLGESIATRTSVSSVLIPRIGLTVFLTVYAVAIMVIIGVPLGIVSAVFRTRADGLLRQHALTDSHRHSHLRDGRRPGGGIRCRAQLVPGSRGRRHRVFLHPRSTT